jgi:hypothetical protein
MTAPQPQFPAVLVLDGHDELIYLPDAASWQAEAEGMQLMPEKDRLVDVQGQLYAPSVAGGGVLRALHETMSLEEFATRVRQHLFAQADTCVSKAGFDSFAEGIAIVASQQG